MRRPLTGHVHIGSHREVRTCDPFMFACQLLEPARLEQARYGNAIMNLKHSRSLPINSPRMDTHTNKGLSVQLVTIPLLLTQSRTHLVCVNTVRLITVAVHP